MQRSWHYNAHVCQKAAVISIQQYAEVIEATFSTSNFRKEKSNYTRFYRLIAKSTGLEIKKAIKFTTENFNDTPNYQNHNNHHKEISIIISKLIRSGHKDLDSLERHLIEVAHELNAYPKDSKAYLRVFCAAALGAREHIGILPSIINITCSGNTTKNLHKDIQLLIAIAIEIENWEKQEKTKGCRSTHEDGNNLSLHIKQYLHAVRIDPLFPRVTTDQIQLRDQFQNSINQRILAVGFCPTLRNNAPLPPINLKITIDLFNNNNYNNKQTNAQRLILANHYIN